MLVRMKSRISFSADGRWRGGGRIPPALREIDNLFGWMQRLLAELSDLRGRYRDFMQGDRALVGQEKAVLIEEMDDLLGGLFRLRRFITPGNPAEFCSVETIERHRFRVEVGPVAWSGEGRAYPWPLEAGTRFADLHNDDILAGLKGLFTAYGRAVADGEISEAESAEIQMQLDGVIFALFRAEYYLMRAELDR